MPGTSPPKRSQDCYVVIMSTAFQDLQSFSCSCTDDISALLIRVLPWTSSSHIWFVKNDDWWLHYLWYNRAKFQKNPSYKLRLALSSNALSAEKQWSTTIGRWPKAPRLDATIELFTPHTLYVNVEPKIKQALEEQSWLNTTTWWLICHHWLTALANLVDQIEGNTNKTRRVSTEFNKSNNGPLVLNTACHQFRESWLKWSPEWISNQGHALWLCLVLPFGNILIFTYSKYGTNEALCMFYRSSWCPHSLHLRNWIVNFTSNSRPALTNSRLH